MAAACPYCLRVYSAANPATGDHVFLRYLGGHAQIEACKECNTQTFGQIEGQWQAGNTWGAFSAGKRHRATPAGGGPPIEIDPSAGTFRSTQPVDKVSEPGRTEYTLRGSPEQVEEILRRMAPKLGLGEQEIQKHLANARSEPITYVNVSLTYDTLLAERSSAKIALGSLVLARGLDAANSSLADSLRRVAFSTSRIAGLTRVGSAPVDLVREIVNGSGDGLADDGSSTCLLTMSAGRTAVFVTLRGGAFPAWGLLIAGQPPDADEIGIVVEDAPHRARVIELASLIAGATELGEEPTSNAP